MTLVEAAAVLGVSSSTLRSQVRHGGLHATKVGRDWTVTPREVERYRIESLGQRKATGGAMNANGRTPEERFWSQVDKSGGPAACWPWTGARQASGYGRVTIDRRAQGAHRVSFAMVNGPIPDGMDVCHSCDNPPCVNPAHLSLGTRKANHRDMREKGRSAPGEKRWNARFTDDDVRAIRARYVAGGVTQSALAAEYKVGRRAIGRVIDGTRWAHIT